MNTVMSVILFLFVDVFTPEHTLMEVICAPANFVAYSEFSSNAQANSPFTLTAFSARAVYGSSARVKSIDISCPSSRAGALTTEAGCGIVEAAGPTVISELETGITCSPAALRRVETHRHNVSKVFLIKL